MRASKQNVKIREFWWQKFGFDPPCTPAHIMIIMTISLLRSSCADCGNCLQISDFVSSHLWLCFHWFSLTICHIVNIVIKRWTLWWSRCSELSFQWLRSMYRTSDDGDCGDLDGGDNGEAIDNAKKTRWQKFAAGTDVFPADRGEMTILESFWLKCLLCKIFSCLQRIQGPSYFKLQTEH